MDEDTVPSEFNFSEKYSLARLADQVEINDVLHLISRGVDRKDWALVATGYHADGVDNHGTYQGPVAGFIQYLQKRHETVEFSMHSLTNIVIEFSGPDTALVESYCYVWQRFSENHVEPVVNVSLPQAGRFERFSANRYVDLFTRENDRWRIKERTVIAEATQTLTPDTCLPELSKAFIAGRRDEHDFLLLMRAKHL